MEDLQEEIAERPGSLQSGLDARNSVEAIRTAAETRLVHKMLAAVLQSVPFRNSKQCRDLLSYVVEQSLANHDNLLRERVIGSAIFGRAPDYDTANDPIVRARMAEVRKRLAQYYQSAPLEVSPVRIEILPGHYKAHFHFVEETAPSVIEERKAEPVEEISGNLLPVSEFPAYPAVASPAATYSKSRTHFGLIAGITFVALLLAGGLAAGVKLLHTPRQTALDQFWSPVLNNPMPVLIYTGTNVVYRFTPAFLNQYMKTHHLQNNGPEFDVDLQSLGTVKASDLMVSNNSYVTTGDVSACAAIGSMLVQYKKPYELRYASDISPGDLQTAPVVLIGAFNNPWTLEITKPLRFTFSGGNMIVDRFTPGRSWTVNAQPNGNTTDDYAIISRLLTSDHAETVMTASGIGEYGTQAASEFLSSPEKMDAFARSAPAGWSHKNLEIVVHVKVVDDVPVSQNIVATYFW